MKKKSLREEFEDITDNGRAGGREIAGNIYERFGNIRGSIIVSVLAVTGITMMSFMGLYTMGKKVFGFDK